jgi:hypothetical protein
MSAINMRLVLCCALTWFSVTASSSENHGDRFALACRDVGGSGSDGKSVKFRHNKTVLKYVIDEGAETVLALRLYRNRVVGNPVAVCDLGSGQRKVTFSRTAIVIEDSQTENLSVMGPGTTWCEFHADRRTGLVRYQEGVTGIDVPRPDISSTQVCERTVTTDYNSPMNKF